MTDLRVPPASGSTRPAHAPGRGRTEAPRRPARGLRPVRRVHEAVLRIDAMTPPDRDRAVDVLRAVAIAGVVLGHWLVTGITLRAGGHLAGDSPLHHMPGFTPLTWVLQSLALFFLVGGRVGARSCASARRAGLGYRVWLRRRTARLLRPAVPLVGTWALAWAGLTAAGTAHETVHTLVTLAFSPLWFLVVYLALTAATPLVSRYGPQTALAAGLTVACLDGARAAFGDDGIVAVLRLVNVPAGWLVPYALGAAWASGRLRRRRQALALLVGGVCSMAALILWCGYPAGMVGVPGAPVSNLDPPSAAAVAFGLAQCGAALLLSRPLRRLVGQPRRGTPPTVEHGVCRARPAQWAWAATALVNMSAIAVFLWHQTAMMATTLVPLGLGWYATGLHGSPDSVAWVLARLAWIPLFGVVLCVLLVALDGRAAPGGSPGSRGRGARSRRHRERGRS